MCTCKQITCSSIIQLLLTLHHLTVLSFVPVCQMNRKFICLSFHKKPRSSGGTAAGPDPLQPGRQVPAAGKAVNWNYQQGWKSSLICKMMWLTCRTVIRDKGFGVLHSAAGFWGSPKGQESQTLRTGEGKNNNCWLKFVTVERIYLMATSYSNKWHYSSGYLPAYWGARFFRKGLPVSEGWAQTPGAARGWNQPLWHWTVRVMFMINTS